MVKNRTPEDANTDAGLARFHVYKNLAWLNELPQNQAEGAFLDCCGSTAWAQQMANERPFKMVEHLFQRAEAKWFNLSRADHLEAFASHPRIGSKKTAKNQNARSAEWSEGEQSSVDNAPTPTMDQLAEVNRLYQDKFGFIFIVCATGKTADEMLAICKARLRNSVETELRIAAVEQSKITEIRLNKLLET